MPGMTSKSTAVFKGADLEVQAGQQESSYPQLKANLGYMRANLRNTKTTTRKQLATESRAVQNSHGHPTKSAWRQKWLRNFTGQEGLRGE